MFLVPEEMQLVPKVYSPIPNCLLHIVNNDTGEELDMAVNEAGAHVCQPNKVCGCYKPCTSKSVGLPGVIMLGTFLFVHETNPTRENSK